MYLPAAGPPDRPQIGTRPTDGQSLSILLKRPIRGVFIHVSPMEACAAVRRIPEVIDIVSFGFEALNHLGIVRIPPAGGDIDAGHIEYD